MVLQQGMRYQVDNRNKNQPLFIRRKTGKIPAVAVQCQEAGFGTPVYITQVLGSDKRAGMGCRPASTGVKSSITSLTS